MGADIMTTVQEAASAVTGPAAEPATSGTAQRVAVQWSASLPLHNMWELGPIKTAIGLQHLQPGWDGYGSPPPSENLVEGAIHLIRQIAILAPGGLEPPNVVPLARGGIQLEWHVGDRELEIPIFPDGRVEFLTVQDGEPQAENELTTYRQMRNLLSWLMSGAG